MSTKAKLIILAGVYIVFMLTVFRSAVEASRWVGILEVGEPLPIQIFVSNSLFNMQQFMFVQTFFFVMYLFLTHKPITSPQFILRCRPHYFRKLLLLGMKRAGGYSLFAILVSTITPMLCGAPFVLDLWYFSHSLRFFLLVFVMFLIYLTLLFVVKQATFSVIGLGVLNFIISAATLATWNVELETAVLNYYLAFGIGLIGFIYLKCKKGEFI